MEESPKYEKVNHPDHYFRGGMECIDVSETFSSNLGQAIQYIWRAGCKPGVPIEEDLKKAVWMINREITRLSKS